MTAKKKPPGIIMKYFPDCYSYEEGELNRILSAALQTKECQQVIAQIKLESREITLSPNAPKERVEKYWAIWRLTVTIWSSGWKVCCNDSHSVTKMGIWCKWDMFLEKADDRFNNRNLKSTFWGIRI